MTTAARPGIDPGNQTATTMQSTPISLPLLSQQCEDERQRIRTQFNSGVPVRATLRALCDLGDRTIFQVFAEILRAHRGPAALETDGQQASGLSLIALGGYGRRLLYPYSDLDLLFLFANDKAEQEFRPLISEFSRTLWDLGFRVSSAGRTVEECKRIEEDNAEFHLALLDRRFLAGDTELHARLDVKVLPASERQARPFLLSELQRLTRERLARYGDTIYHLEPNVKEAPGGLRDYHASAWLRQLAGEKGEIRGANAADEELAASAVDFLSAIRCFLHYSNERNDNTLTYEQQAAAAERSLSAPGQPDRNPAEWMRLYFRHARTLNRQLLRLLEHRAPVQLSLRQRIFQSARPARFEPVSGRPYAVRDGLFELLDLPALADRSVTYSLFIEAAKIGTPLSRETERGIAYILNHPELPVRNPVVTWAQLREIAGADSPGVALRPMQRLGLLNEALPEFAKIDSLVVRDFYHRYTVDEHSLRTIEHLQELTDTADVRGKHFAGLWKTVERRDLLVLTLLLHDVGKGMPVENHIAGSLEALDCAAKRLQLTPEETAEIHFLIAHHLDMSATVQRRDIFDPATVSAFAATAGTQERLQRLCLLTYADIHAVNPEALTPWKAEMLWQLYVATSNYLSRTVDRDRLNAAAEAPLLEQVRVLTGKSDTEEIERFLEGFPRRYLAVHSAAEIAAHFALYEKLSAERVQTELKESRHVYSLAILTPDRAALFATISGVLAGWGMNIVKAEAFANAAGVVLDTFHFSDLYRTIEMNPGEVQRFEQSLKDVISGKAPLEPLLKSREGAAALRPRKVPVETKITFDDSSSIHCTLLEIITQDRPGLLYDIGSMLARLSCNIEVALIDTEGQKAIDVFYLTSQGKKLSPSKRDALRESLQGSLN